MSGTYLAAATAVTTYHDGVTGWWIAAGAAVVMVAATALAVGFFIGTRAVRYDAAANDDAPDAADEASVLTAHDDAAVRAAELFRRDFVANVSHELKSPVTAIGLLAEAVMEAAESPETVTSFAQRMQRESVRLGALIADIIALSAIQGGGLHDVDLVRVDDVISDAIDRATVTASAAGITIRVDGTSGASVTGDRGLLTTAIGNLVDNAVHYSGAGSVVTVSQQVHGDAVDIAVSDSGIGIAPADQLRVFERFFRADPARSRATGGTGLGLAIVKHVASNHGGSIRLDSQVGLGSTFTLHLPLAGTAAAPLLISAIEAAGPHEAADVTDDERLAIPDDDIWQTMVRDRREPGEEGR